MQMVSALFNHIPELKSINEQSRNRMVQCACCQMAVLSGSYKYQIECYNQAQTKALALRYRTLYFYRILFLFIGRVTNQLIICRWMGQKLERKD